MIRTPRTPSTSARLRWRWRTGTPFVWWLSGWRGSRNLLLTSCWEIITSSTGGDDDLLRWTTSFLLDPTSLADRLTEPKGFLPNSWPLESWEREENPTCKPSTLACWAEVWTNGWPTGWPWLVDPNPSGVWILISASFPPSNHANKISLHSGNSGF